jgi:hypothetical protein
MSALRLSLQHGGGAFGARERGRLGRLQVVDRCNEGGDRTFFGRLSATVGRWVDLLVLTMAILQYWWWW